MSTIGLFTALYVALRVVVCLLTAWQGRIHSMAARGSQVSCEALSGLPGRVARVGRLNVLEWLSAGYRRSEDFQEKLYEVDHKTLTHTQPACYAPAKRTDNIRSYLIGHLSGRLPKRTCPTFPKYYDIVRFMMIYQYIVGFIILCRIYTLYPKYRITS